MTDLLVSDSSCVFSCASTPLSQSIEFVQVRVQDNVKAQYRLVTEQFGINKLVMVIGWSMGAGQTFQWGVRYAQGLHLVGWGVKGCGRVG